MGKIMVKYKYILKVIEDYTVKCPTIAEMKSMLGNMTQAEKNQQFDEQGLLNKGEKKWYTQINKMIKGLTPQREEMERNLQYAIDKDIGYMIEGCKSNLRYYDNEEERLNNLAFQFERRLIEGYNPKRNEPRVVDESKYSLEKQIQTNSIDIGTLEQAQIEAQESIEFTDDELGSLQFYYGSGAYDLNSKLNNGRTWKVFAEDDLDVVKKQLNVADRNIHKAIGKTGGLLQDTIVFHGGKFDVTKMVGDKVKFKGYVSTSFQQIVAQNSMNSSPDNKPLQYQYKILLPKGTKGLCANDRSQGKLTNVTMEHEYLLDKGMEFDIVDIDYGNQIVTVVASD